MSLEQRLNAVEVILDQKQKVEEQKQSMIDETGTTYKVSAIIETDKGSKSIQFDVKAWSEKQALYYANQNVIYPNMSKLQSEGKIRWFKTIKKEIIK